MSISVHVLYNDVIIAVYIEAKSCKDLKSKKPSLTNGNYLLGSFRVSILIFPSFGYKVDKKHIISCCLISNLI
jgi:hypothetical protein